MPTPGGFQYSCWAACAPLTQKPCLNLAFLGLTSLSVYESCVTWFALQELQAEQGQEDHMQ